MRGNSGGAEIECISGWNWNDQGQCCESSTSCSGCTTRSGCGWCDTTDECTHGTSSGRGDGRACADWDFYVGGCFL